MKNMKTTHTLGLILLLAAGCATSSDPAPTDTGRREVSRYAVVDAGPELEVALGFYQATTSIGEEWLVVAVEMTSASRGGRVDVSRSDITMMTPSGRRLGLISQEEFREVYPSIRIMVERSLRSLPILGRYKSSQVPCSRWFLEDPFGGFGHDEITINTFRLCSGPLAFRVPGGVQPGRWRLLIDLQESRVDIPFELFSDE
jgi:hypothetical protein